MKSPMLLIAAGLLAVLPLSAHARIERVVEKTFSVKPGGLLTVDTDGGNISVETANDAKVTVTAKQKIKASSEAEADELLKKLTLDIDQSGDDVTAKARYEKISWGSRPVQVDFVVVVPANYRVALKTSGGDVKVGDLKGQVRARTSGGNISLGKIGGDIDAHTSGGNVSLAEGAGSVKLGTSGGNIHVNRAVGPTDLDTSGGDIDIKSVENTIHASTSGGNVSAGIVGSFKGDCELSTSGGQVRASVEPSAAFTLDASTSGGGVEADGLTITIEKGGAGKSRLAGKVNGGGPVLKLRSSGGDVSVKVH